MATEEIQEKIEKLIGELLQPEPAYFLVQVKIKPVNNIKVFIDGDQGVTIDACSRLNRGLYKQLEELKLFPDGDFSLEVSSAGVGEPLKQYRQYVKNIGRTVLVALNDGNSLEGILKTVEETGIGIETVTGTGKKATVNQQTIPFDNIKSTTVQIKF